MKPELQTSTDQPPPAGSLPLSTSSGALQTQKPLELPPSGYEVVTERLRGVTDSHWKCHGEEAHYVTGEEAHHVTGEEAHHVTGETAAAILFE